MASPRIVFFDLETITDEDILWALFELGYTDVVRPEPRVPDAEYTEENVQTILDEITDAALVVTRDFSAATAEACHRKNCLYLSWVHDSPQRSLYMKEALYDTNRVFVFDRKQLARMKERGIPHVYYQPLSANIARTSALHISDDDITRFSSDISFVGNLYESKARERFFEAIPEDARAEVEQIIVNKTGYWDGEHTIYTPLRPGLVEKLAPHLSGEGLENYQMPLDFVLQITVLAREAAMRERLFALGVLSEQFHVSLYTSHPDYAAEFLPDVNVYGKVSYMTEMPAVFFSSKINLNLTIPTIESGIPQRVFDIMSVGGFVLSNDQEEIHELFVPDEEIVVFSDIDDLVAKCDYYLRHEEERLRIAIRGYKKVRENYSTLQAVKRMLDQIGICH